MNSSSYPVTRRAALLGAGAMLAAPAVHAQGRTSGVALVIGNSKYQWEAALPNVRRDAPDIAKRFEQLGLKVQLLQDLTRGPLRQAFEKFGAVAKGAPFATVYFAGHGVSWNKNQFVVPVDADLSSPEIVKVLVGGGRLRDSLAGAENRLLVFDACRNNPADGWRQKQEEERARGRQDESGVDERDPPNLVTLFSTIPGRAALDGPAGQNSPFCAAFLRQLSAPPVDLTSLPGRLRRDLLIATGGRQVLWDRNTFRAPFTLAGPPDATARAAGDARRVLELPNAYAYAAQNGLPMPPGLIGYRPAAGAREAVQVGAFRFSGYNQEAALLVVMSSEDPQNVELMQAIRDKSRQTKWRFLRGTSKGDSIEFFNPDQSLNWSFRWSDANAGKLAIHPQSGGGRMVTGSFTRLD